MKSLVELGDHNEMKAALEHYVTAEELLYTQCDDSGAKEYLARWVDVDDELDKHIRSMVRIIDIGLSCMQMGTSPEAKMFLSSPFYRAILLIVNDLKNAADDEYMSSLDDV